MSNGAIVNVLNLYSAALDGHVWELFDQVFAPEVEADYPGVLHWWDLASFKRDFAEYHEALESHQHIMTNHQVLENGDTANSLTYGSFRLVEKNNGADGSRIRQGCTWYDDQLVRSDAGWRIRKRMARVFWAGGVAPARNVIAGSGEEQDVKEGFGNETKMGEMNRLFVEAKAGQVAYFNALKQKYAQP